MRLTSLVVSASFFLLAGCGGPAPGRYRIDALTLPTASDRLAVDLDGDGRPDDALARVIGILEGAGGDPQAAVDGAIASRTLPFALVVGARGEIAVALPALSKEVSLAAPRLALDSASDDGSFSAQLDGAVRAPELDAFAPTLVAGLISTAIAGAPDGALERELLRLFDDHAAPCTDPDGTPASPDDGRISPCEVQESAIYRELFAPDVALDGTVKDGFSLGAHLRASLKE